MTLRGTTTNKPLHWEKRQRKGPYQKMTPEDHFALTPEEEKHLPKFARAINKRAGEQNAIPATKIAEAMSITTEQVGSLLRHCQYHGHVKALVEGPSGIYKATKTEDVSQWSKNVHDKTNAYSAAMTEGASLGRLFALMDLGNAVCHLTLRVRQQFKLQT